MKLRLCSLLFVLSLTGCSLFSSDWFGEGLSFSEQGFNTIGVGTPFKEAILQEAVGSEYKLQPGMATKNGQIVSFYQALDSEGRVRLRFYSGADATVVFIESNAHEIAGLDDVQIGTPFSDIYQQAFGVCKRGQVAGVIICVAPNSQHISYQFEGEWKGPAELIPSDDVLKNWTVSRIIWQAKLG